MPNEPVIYTAQAFNDIPPVQNASAADFIFSSPFAPLNDTVAFTDAVTGVKLTRKEVYDFSLRLAWKVEGMGLVHRKKSVAMIFSPNSISWPITFFGLQTAGIIATLANSAYTPAELAHQLRDSGARVVFVHPLLLPTLMETWKLLGVSEKDAKWRTVLMSWTEQDERDEATVGVQGSKEWKRLKDLVKGSGKKQGPIELSGSQTDATALMCYSSGTTGLSKGVETTHRNIVTLLQIYWPFRPKFDINKDVEMGLLPLYHIFGIIKLLCLSMWAGLPVVLIPKFEPVLFFKTVETYKISLVKLVPPVLVHLATHPAFEQHDLKSLWHLFSGAAPLGEGLVRRVKARFEKVHGTKPYIVQGYGLTEMSPTTHMLPDADDMRKVGSIGLLLPTLECRLIDEDGNDVEKGSGKPGELWMRGKSVMKGYMNNPVATANTITKDGWFKSGDVAVRDDEGYFYIVDRKKELIKYKGFQVPPADLEAVLLTNEKVADAGVIGIESQEQATELPRAYVVPTDSALLPSANPPPSPAAVRAYEEEVAEWIKTKVAKHKYLRGGVKVVDIIPKSGAGKILRRELREMAKAEAKQDLEKSLRANGAKIEAKL
ncbi:AMP binding protein [Clavulina sp. PMI_390]|nr:AMP binding protein [Clavulina sp. PMI_390]